MKNKSTAREEKGTSAGPRPCSSSRTYGGRNCKLPFGTELPHQVNPDGKRKELWTVSARCQPAVN